MPKPRKGDVLRWTDSVWRLEEDPTPVSSTKTAFQCVATCVKGDGFSFRKGKRDIVMFQKDTVEDSGWTYEEDPFVTFCKEVLNGQHTA